MAINLKSVFNWSQSVAPPMNENDVGRIIDISSVSANTGGSLQATSCSDVIGPCWRAGGYRGCLCISGDAEPLFMTGEVIDVDSGANIN